MTIARHCFSAPGKAFVAGGYLVLDPENPAFVTALSARIYAITTPSLSLDRTLPTITVLSPQFQGGEWSYSLCRSPTTSFVSLSAVTPSSRNPFVQSAVATVINYLSATGALKTSVASLRITILSDNAYHSQPSDPVPQFNKHQLPIEAVPKTGLGSSAALTTSLVAALLSFYASIDPVASESKKILHNLAQVAHCNAQGKVGSGFDVACAVYGSIVYHRFQPSIISSLPSAPTSSENEPEVSYLLSLKNVIEVDWQVGTDACAIPRRLRLLMGDVTGGSETPAMVQKVLRWRKDGGQSAEAVWTTLGKANEKLIATMIELGEQAVEKPDEYDAFVDGIVNANTSGIRQLGLSRGGRTGQLFAQAVDAIVEIRHNLRIMTSGSGAQIEPVEQTKLLDACSVLPGVLGGVVPGAGGYDAVCLIVAEAAVDDITKHTDGEFKNVKWLELREEATGVREEDMHEIEKFL
ncbi:ribosomal protein S5 domain 2-type protein [Lipomyces kononenkoae]|uniref:Ribosomal protein S5 domain 2-type protein n=1 Tax=Lipomyces kononenkoae TaxID=34357 RepID=A0ACC3SUH6_LIPKO